VAGSSDAQETPRGRRRPGFRFLLGGLIALLMGFPYLEDVARPLILVIPIAFVFVVGVMVAEGGRADDLRASVIAALQVGFTVLSLVARDRDALYMVAVTLALLATVTLMLFATNCILRYVLRARMISRDQIYAGICMYLMLGFAFGSVYYLLNVLNTESFAESNPGSRANPDLMYFSFVTLATLGYGDITPRTNLARSVAVLEATGGMLYIAVFMARLVSMYSTGGEKN
jgi:hypothetical protein